MVKTYISRLVVLCNHVILWTRGNPFTKPCRASLVSPRPAWAKRLAMLAHGAWSLAWCASLHMAWMVVFTRAWIVRSFISQTQLRVDHATRHACARCARVVHQAHERSHTQPHTEPNEPTIKQPREHTTDQLDEHGEQKRPGIMSQATRVNI